MARLLPLLPVLCLVLTLCVIAQGVMMAGLNARFARQTKMLRQFFSGPQGEDLEALLERNLTQTQQALCNSELALERVSQDAARAENCLQRFALVRYDAFGDVTGQQSFSLALLDGQSNGTIVTSLLGRQNSRCFGKVIIGGQPEQPLSDEEQRVLEMAIKSQTPDFAPLLSKTRNGHAARVAAQNTLQEQLKVSSN